MDAWIQTLDLLSSHRGVLVIGSRRTCSLPTTEHSVGLNSQRSLLFPPWPSSLASQVSG